MSENKKQENLVRDRHKKLNEEFEGLNRLQGGPATKTIISVIGAQTLRFVIRTYRLINNLPTRFTDKEINKSLLKIGKECRELLGRSIQPDKFHDDLAKLLSKKENEYQPGKKKYEDNATLSEQDSKQFTAVELFENIVINEAHDMLNFYAHEELSQVYLKIQDNPANRPVDYASHYLVYALNFFLKQFRPDLDTASMISSFVKEQHIAEAGGLAESKNIKERYLDKHDTAFINEIGIYYDRALLLVAMRRAIKKNDKAQYIFDEKAKNVSRLIADDLSSKILPEEISSIIFFFPPWDEVFKKH